MRVPNRGALLAVLLAAALAAITGVALAKGAANAAKGKPKTFLDACRDDREKFCHDVVLGHGRLLLCLKEQQDNLTPECVKFFLGDREPTKL